MSAAGGSPFNPCKIGKNQMCLKYALVLTGLLTFTATAEAALAPNYQRAKEMMAVIEAVADEITRYPVTKVIYQKPDQYQVIAGPCSIRARIVTRPQKQMMVGPRQFEVKLFLQRCGK
ncbi:hypothetical protein ACWGNA_05785 [Brucella cytisi]|uniref:hypothetical protein n=1 Tax=Brucella cytisi TaxID=407152 RepID=UPI0035DA14B1